MPIPPGPYFLAEWYRTDLEIDHVDHVTATLQRAAAERVEGSHRVQLLSVLGAPTDDVLFALFAASDARLVALVCLAAGMPTDRITAQVQARILT
jgi:hypothetical protein